MKLTIQNKYVVDVAVRDVDGNNSTKARSKIKCH